MVTDAWFRTTERIQIYENNLMLVFYLTTGLTPRGLIDHEYLHTTRIFARISVTKMAEVELNNRQYGLRSTNIAMLVLAVIFVVLRFLSRRLKGMEFGADDAMILVALVSSNRCSERVEANTF